MTDPTPLERIADEAIAASDHGHPLVLTPDQLRTLAAAGPGEWDDALRAVVPETAYRPVGTIVVRHAPRPPRSRRRPAR